MSTSPAWLSLLQSTLSSCLSAPTSRYLQLASLTPSGLASVRTVVFRGFFSYNHDHTLKMVTDSRSHKIPGLKHNPAAELCWYFVDSRRQFRITGNILLVDHHCQEHVLMKEREKQWREMSENGKQGFRGGPPGEPLDEKEKEDGGSDGKEELKNDKVEECFVLMLMQPVCVDVVDLRSGTRVKHEKRHQRWVESEVNP